LFIEKEREREREERGERREERDSFYDKMFLCKIVLKEEIN